MTSVIWNFTLVYLEIVLVSVQDMSTCWYFGEEDQVEARLDLFRDCANLDAR